MYRYSQDFFLHISIQRSLTLAVFAAMSDSCRK